MNRSSTRFLALALAASASLGPLLSPIRPARAQYTGAMGYRFNNGSSALLSVMIQNNINGSMIRNQMRSSRAYTRTGSSGLSAAQRQQQRGQSLVKSGRATTSFAMRPFPIDYYMKTAWSGNGDAAKRKHNYEEWLAQSALWRAEAQARGAKFGDYAQMHALAFVMCAQAYNGGRVSNQGWKHKADSIRRYYLKDAGFQSWTPTQKQEGYESLMLSASYALYLRQTGDTEKARQTASTWLSANWDTDHPGVPDAQDAVATLTRFVTPGRTKARIARTPARRATPSNKPLSLPVSAPSNAPAASDAPSTPALSFEQAARATHFTPSAKSLVPEMLAANYAPGKRDQMLKLYTQLLKMMHAQSHHDSEVPVGSSEDVAQAMTTMLAYFYVLAREPIDQRGSVTVTGAQQEALHRQLTLAMGSDPQFRAQSVSQKQTAFEAMLLLTSVLIMAGKQAQQSGDMEIHKQVQALASQSLQSLLGTTPDKMRFTNTGLQLD